MLEIAGVEILEPDGHTAAYALLETLFREATGRPLPEIARTERGKPYFLNEKLCFSITHTKYHAFCVLSERPVGIDAEEMDRKIDLRLADKILSPAEKCRYEAAEDKQKALLTFWVLKEAAAKCSGEGLRGYPDHTDFSLEDPRVFEHRGCLVAIIEEDAYAV